MAAAHQPLLKDLSQKEEPLVGLYCMFYRQPENGNHLITKNFRFHGSLKEARERAELHCGIIGAKLNFVQPLIANLKLEEDFKLGSQVKKDL
jgi:hypothetical protein